MHYVMADGHRRHDYRGVIVRDNLIDNFGSRIHIAVPMGGPPWSENLTGTTLVGASITKNTVTGDGGGYGFIANGVDQFTVVDNVSTAKFSGIGDGLVGKPPDPPAAFLFDPQQIGSSTLQDEFTPKRPDRHLVHLLRNYWRPSAPNGYRLAEYGEAEAEAVARAALYEILGKKPTADEISHWAGWLMKSKSTADDLRQELTNTEDFKKHGSELPSGGMEEYRTALWLTILTRKSEELAPDKSDGWPSASEIYAGAIDALDRE
jgi:hypothetical protein